MVRPPDAPASARTAADYPQAAFVLMSVSTFLMMVGLSMLSPVLATLSDDRGLSPVQAGLLLGAYLLGRLLSAVPAGMLADRVTMRRAATIGCALTLCASLGAGLSTSFGVLLVMQLLQGIGSSIHTTAALAFVMALVPVHRTGRLLATHQGLVLLGVSFSPVLGGVAVTYLDADGPFWIYAGVVGVAWVFAVLAASRTEAPGPTPRRSSVGIDPSEPAGPAHRRLLGDRTFLASLVVAFGLHWMIAGIRNTLVPLFAELALGFEPLVVGLMLGAGAASNGVALFFSGRTADRVGRRPLLVYGSLAVTVSVASFSLSGRGSVLVPLLVLGAANGYAGAAPPAIMADIADAGIRGVAVGIQRTATGLGLWLGPVCIGYILTFMSYRPAFLVATAVIAVLLACSVLTVETMPARAPSSTP